MSRNLTILLSLALMLSIAGKASAELVGYWKFDEGSGTVAADSSALGNDGTLSGNATWVDGQIDGTCGVRGPAVCVRRKGKTVRLGARW